MINQKEKRKRNSKADLIFYCILMTWPVVQFLVFYVGVNINSILIAFQDINLLENSSEFTARNFVTAFQKLFSPTLLIMVKNSFFAYAITLCTSIPLGLLFSHYIYKKLPGAGIFRVVLFMPSIVSSIIMVLMFKYFTTDALPAMMKDFFRIEMKAPLDSTEYGPRFGTIMLYNVFVGFGTSVLMYSNKMATIDPSIPEAACIDGASGLKEFWYITLPLVFPTMSVFIITGVAQLFTNQINLFSFYGTKAAESIQTLGYWMYVQAKKATGNGLAGFSELSAMGLILTAIAVPITLLVKWLLEKYGPSEE